MKYSIIAGLLFTSFMSAQENNQPVQDSIPVNELNEVVVTATRTLRQLSSLPLPAQLISKQELKQSNRIRLNTILTEQTGLTTVQNFIGGEGIQMQGLGSEYTLVLIDGVPLVGRSAGTLDISRVAIGNIKQIEIVKGASSSLYGSEALGGVINIITEKPVKSNVSGNLNYRFGSFNSHDTNLNVSLKNKSSSFNLFVNRNSSDGYNLANAVDVNTIDPYANYTVNLKTLFNISEKSSLSVSGRYFNQDQDYVPTESVGGKIEVDEWNTHLKYEHEFNSKWNSYFEFYATQYKANDFLNNLDDNSLFSESFYNEKLLRPEFRVTYTPNEKSTIISGLGMDHETLTRSDFSTEPIFNSPYIYLQYEADIVENLNLILGARFDNHNEYKSQFSPKGAFRYKLNDKIALKGSVGYGFKAPDFRQLYFDLAGIAGYTILGFNTVATRIPEMINNGEIAGASDIIVPLTFFEDQLKPESSISFNLGTTINPKPGLKLELNLFRNDINDLIDTKLIANKINGSGVYSYVNTNKAYTQGLEFNASWRTSRSFKISGGYQLLYAKDKEAQEEFENGNAFAFIPGFGSIQLDKSDYFGLYNRSRHMANLKLFYNNSDLNLNSNLRATYRSKYGLFDTNNNSYLDKYDDFVSAHTLWNWSINKTFYNNYEFGFGIDNIFDYTDIPESQGDFIFIANLPGRIIYTKLNITF